MFYKAVFLFRSKDMRTPEQYGSFVYETDVENKQLIPYVLAKRDFNFLDEMNIRYDKSRISQDFANFLFNTKDRVKNIYVDELPHLLPATEIFKVGVVQDGQVTSMEIEGVDFWHAAIQFHRLNRANIRYFLKTGMSQEEAKELCGKYQGMPAFVSNRPASSASNETEETEELGKNDEFCFEYLKDGVMDSFRFTATDFWDALHISRFLQKDQIYKLKYRYEQPMWLRDNCEKVKGGHPHRLFKITAMNKQKSPATELRLFFED